MAISTPEWHIARSNLRLAPIGMVIAALAAIVLAFFVPFHATFLAVAAGVGALTFGIQWLCIRLKASLVFIGLLPTIVAFIESRRLLLPPDMSTAELALTSAQFLAVWLLFFATLHIVFRARLIKDLDRCVI